MTMVRARSKRFALPALLCIAPALAPLFLAAPAHADEAGPKATPLSILGIDSDDAEEQADALTTTMRTRIRTSIPGWSTGDATQPLGMLTAALKCSQRPDAGCEARISEQIKQDNFVWGVMKKAGGGKVSVELHLYSKGKPSQIAADTYSDNLKDQNDDSLRREAQSLLTKLLGASEGSVTVHSNIPEGDVLIDDARHEPLKAGAAHVELAAGSHTIVVSSQGYAPQRTTVTVIAGKEATFEATLSEGEKAEPAKPFPTRKVVGYSAIALGVGSGIAAVALGLSYKNLSDAQNKDLQSVPSSVSNVKTACDNGYQGIPVGPEHSSVATACQNYSSNVGAANAESALAWTFGGLAAVGIGVGLWLVLTDHGGEQAPQADPHPTALIPTLHNVQLVPAFAQQSGSLLMTGKF